MFLTQGHWKAASNIHCLFYEKYTARPTTVFNTVFKNNY